MLRESSTGDVMKRQVVFQLSAPPELSQTGEGSLEDARVGLTPPQPTPAQTNPVTFSNHSHLSPPPPAPGNHLSTARLYGCVCAGLFT